ncbi:MAG TPA: ribose-5-phosphate isomerase RpiA [Caulobacteraceae bacterium]|nr:ribose-5-phosphate isomerase RpiA [Caulobacteraceae bacterium]
MTPDEQKAAVGRAAVELVDANTYVIGLGTGSTAAHFTQALPQHLARQGLSNRTFVATSEATATLARSIGLRLTDLDDVGTIDLTVDGADEIGPDLALIKGAGGALLREKLVWEASRRCVVIADASKRVAMLGRLYPLPIEVVRFGHATTLRRIMGGLADCGVAATPRLRLAGDAPFVTDGGNYIYDAHCGAILDPVGVEAALKSITGVVEHGLFLGLAGQALLGTDEGVVTLSR